MNSEQQSSARTSQSNRTSVLCEEVTSIEEGMKGLKQRHNALQDAKGQLDALNNRLVELLKVENDKRLPFEQTFRTFKAGLEAEKQRELMLMALRRKVSSNSFHINFPSSSPTYQGTALQSSEKEENLGERASGENTTASSITSIEEEIYVKDSGLGIDEMSGLKEEMNELKIENSTFQSKVVCLNKEVEDLKAFIDEKDEMVEVLTQKCAMYEGTILSLTSQLNGASEVRKLLEGKLALKDGDLKIMEATSENKILKIKVEQKKRLLEEGSKMKCIEEELARFRHKDAEMSKKVEKLEVDLSAVQLAKNAINHALTDSYEAERVEYEKKIEGLDRKLAERDAVEKSLTVKASSTDLKLSKANSELADVKKLLQSKEVEFTNENEVTRVKFLEERMKFQEQIKKLKRKINEEEALQKYLAEKTSSTEFQLSDTKRELADVKKMLQCKEVAFTKENEVVRAKLLEGGMKFQQQIEELKRKVSEGEALRRSLAEKASSTAILLSKANCELVDVKKVLKCKEMEFTNENEIFQVKFMEESVKYQEKIDELERKLVKEQTLRKSLEEKVSSTEIQLCNANLQLADMKKEHEAALAKFSEVVMKHQKQAEEQLRKMAEREALEKSLAEELSSTNYLLSGADRELASVKKENKVAHVKLLKKQAEKVRISKESKVRVKLMTKEIGKLQKINTAYKEDIWKLQVEFESRHDQIEKLDKQIKALGDNVHLKDKKIEELTKQLKVRGDCLRLQDQRIEDLNKKMIVLEDRLHSKEDEICQLDEQAKAFGHSLYSKDKKMEQLKKEMKNIAGRLSSKDLAIEDLISKAKRRNGIKRLFCC